MLGAGGPEYHNCILFAHVLFNRLQNVCLAFGHFVCVTSDRDQVRIDRVTVGKFYVHSKVVHHLLNDFALDSDQSRVEGVVDVELRLYNARLQLKQQILWLVYNIEGVVDVKLRLNNARLQLKQQIWLVYNIEGVVDVKLRLNNARLQLKQQIWLVYNIEGVVDVKLRLYNARLQLKQHIMIFLYNIEGVVDVKLRLWKQRNTIGR